jgi:hypothetical protein
MANQTNMKHFDPRQAALNHAGNAKIEQSDYGQDLSDLASAIACGLVYVGDQIGRVRPASPPTIQEEGQGGTPVPRQTHKQVETVVRDELDQLFSRLVDKWGMKYGGVDPADEHRWEEVTVPAIIEFVWRWYEGNQIAADYVTVVLEVPPGAGEGIDQSLTLLLGEAPAWQDVTVAATYPGDLVTDPARQS